MARKTDLRAFQEYLAGRLSDAAQGRPAASWLGVESGGEAWLVELPDGGEVVRAPQLAPVPLTRPWFAGVANVRGTLYAVSDFSRFRGGPPTAAPGSLLLIGARHGSNTALLVGRLLGLKNPEEFTPLPPAAGPAWGAARYAAADGQAWRKLAVRELLADQEFMHVGL